MPPHSRTQRVRNGDLFAKPGSNEARLVAIYRREEDAQWWHCARDAVWDIVVGRANATPGQFTRFLNVIERMHGEPDADAAVEAAWRLNGKDGAKGVVAEYINGLALGSIA